jgi:DNA primase
MVWAVGQSGVVDYYTDVVLPALAERLDGAFPEFGWRRDGRGWVATNEEMTHRVLGVRAERVVAHGPAPRGFLIHGADPVLWTSYLSSGQTPRGAEFVRAVRELAERAGVDTAPLGRAEPRDRKAALLGRFFEIAQRELLTERGSRAREYLESRGFPAEAIERAGLGLVPSRERIGGELRRGGFTAEEIDSSGLLADRRWPGRICGAWRDERGHVRTLWARAIGDAPAGARYLYLRGASRLTLPPYGLANVLRGSRERGELVLVEGVFDVHHLRALGDSPVAAIGGLSLAPRTFERLAHHQIQRVTLCLDRDGPGRAATARAVQCGVRAATSPTLEVIDPEHLAPAKDPGELVRVRGFDAWLHVLDKRECAITWRARDLLAGVTPDASSLARRDALRRAGAWLGALPPALALEQDDAVRAVAERCGYDSDAVTRAFRARFWSRPERTQIMSLER